MMPMLARGACVPTNSISTSSLCGCSLGSSVGCSSSSRSSRLSIVASRGISVLRSSRPLLEGRPEPSSSGARAGPMKVRCWPRSFDVSESTKFQRYFYRWQHSVLVLPFNVLCEASVRALLVIFYAPSAFFCSFDGLHEPSSALFGVLTARIALAVLLKLLVLRALVVVAVLF